MSGRRSILIVHGRGFKPAPEAWAELSLSALKTGLARDYPDCVPILESVKAEFAYYGDLTNALLKGRGQSYDEALDIGDRRNALEALAAIPNRKRFGIRQYDRLPGKSALGEFIADVSVPLLGAAGLWMWLCSRKAFDLSVYLQADTDYTSAVRARVRDALLKLIDDGDEILLMSHGIGSAITWDVLWQLSHDDEFSGHIGTHKIDLWLTLGSPLGDRHLRKRLLGADETGHRRYPTNVISWFNVAAEDDYICHDDTLADDFRRMLSEHAISAVQDFKIYNHTVRFGKSNPHSSLGYYIHPRVAKIMAEWLQKGAPPQPVSPVSPDTPE